MFGKHFASMYEGSMMGAGPVVFAVWGYVIAKTVEGEVELNPRLISVLIGVNESEVITAIEYLCSEDPRSRNKSLDGRRLVKTGEYSYSVTSHSLYRGIRHEDDRREYNRRKQAEYRAKNKLCTTVYHGVPPSAHTEAEAEAEAEAPNIVSQPKRKQSRKDMVEYDSAFDEFWAIYPRHTDKVKARKAWAVALKKTDSTTLLEAAERFKKDSIGKDQSYIPHASTWLNGERWEDEAPKPIDKFAHWKLPIEEREALVKREMYSP